MPDPQVYEDEYNHWPWGRLLRKFLEWIVKEAPHGASVFDYMCGTGQLLHLISNERPDLTLAGCDFSKTFIDFGKNKYPHIQLEVGNALEQKLLSDQDFIICMAGIHHLLPANHVSFLDKVANELTPSGWFIVGEEVVRSWSSESERKMSVLELSTAILRELFVNDAPEDQLEAAVLVLRNDLFQRGEFKYSLDQLISFFQRRFVIENAIQVWPTDSEPFGDYLIFSKLR